MELGHSYDSQKHNKYPLLAVAGMNLLDVSITITTLGSCPDEKIQVSLYFSLKFPVTKREMMKLIQKATSA